MNWSCVVCGQQFHNQPDMRRGVHFPETRVAVLLGLTSFVTMETLEQAKILAFAAEAARRAVVHADKCQTAGLTVLERAWRDIAEKLEHMTRLQTRALREPGFVGQTEKQVIVRNTADGSEYATPDTRTDNPLPWGHGVTEQPPGTVRNMFTGAPEPPKELEPKRRRK